MQKIFHFYQTDNILPTVGEVTSVLWNTHSMTQTNLAQCSKIKIMDLKSKKFIHLISFVLFTKCRAITNWESATRKIDVSSLSIHRGRYYLLYTMCEANPMTFARLKFQTWKLWFSDGAKKKRTQKSRWYGIVLHCLLTVWCSIQFSTS